jgi:hypothetical protein
VARPSPPAGWSLGPWVVQPVALSTGIAAARWVADSRRNLLPVRILGLGDGMQLTVDEPARRRATVDPVEFTGSKIVVTLTRLGDGPQP